MWLEVGRIGRAHGLGGDVHVTLSTDRTERLDPGSHLRAGSRDLIVERAKPQQHRWIVHFVDVVRREDADALRGVVLSAEALDEPDTLWVHGVIGRAVFGVDGTSFGLVEAVLENPAHDLLVLEGGALVPVVFITDDSDPARLVIDPPEGLLEP